jgi:two-component system, LytTR family, sensor kinase
VLALRDARRVLDVLRASGLEGRFRLILNRVGRGEIVPDDAERVIERLAYIFRYILQTEDRTFVPLRDEIALVRNYLSIEKVRFGSNLSIEYDLEEDLLDIEVPAFAVQTLVENAVKHGIERKRGGGLISMAARRAPRRDAVEIEVSDTGVGIPAIFPGTGGDGLPEALPDETFFGVGLRNVSDRLTQLYGERDLLHFQSGPVDGTTVIMTIPLEQEAIS